MGKLLRVLVVLLLLLGIAALALGVMLFQKRETLKGHVQDLAENVLSLSRHVEAEQVDDLTQTDLPRMDKVVTRDQLLGYSLDPQTRRADTNSPMVQIMGQLIGKANIQASRLNDTRLALSQKIQELDVATNKIAELEATIVRLEEEKKQLQDQVAALEKELAERKAKIESLTVSLEEAASTIDDQKSQIAKLKDDLLDKDDQLKRLDETIKKLEEKIAQYTGGGGTSKNVDIKPGTKGQIILVNTQWNFAVVSVNEGTPVAMGVELLVQRDDQLVGKIKVSDLNDQYKLAICDILLDWKQADLEVGDYVFY